MKFIFSFFLFVIPFKIFSQDSVLTIQKAIEIGLINNYDIRIAHNVTEQQENNNTAGNAGMLPDVDLSGFYTRSSNSLDQKYNNGTEVNRDAIKATNMSADLGLTWTIFDGTRMFSAKSQLSEISKQSIDQLELQMENSIQDIISTYYSMVRQRQLLKALAEEIKFSDERLKIADRKMNNGSGSRLDWLQSKTDYNRQLAAEITLRTQIEASRVRLNELLGRNVETFFSTEDTVVITYRPDYEELKKTVPEQNNELSFFKRDYRIAELELKQNRAFRSPIISVNTHYISTKNTSEAGLTLFNKIQGFNYGASATFPLFHGFNISRQIKNSKLDVVNSGIRLESEKTRVSADLFIAWRVFTNSLELLKMEEQNIIYAREVLAVANERYRIRVSTIIEQQDAQNTFEDAMVRLADARYNAKVSETALRKLNGELVK